MEDFAEQTGGQAYFSTNGLKEAAVKAGENGSSYYTIGYVPATKKLDGKFRSIKVHLDDSHFELAYRRGYYSVPADSLSGGDPKASALFTEAVAHGAPTAVQILFQARVLPTMDPLLRGTNVPAGPAGEMAVGLKGPMQHTVIDLTLDPHGLTFSETPEGVHSARIECALAAYDADGKRVNYLLRGIQLNIKRESYARVVADGVPLRLALDLPVGQSFLRIVVYDLDAGKVGSLEVPVTAVADNGLSSAGGRPINAQFSVSHEDSAHSPDLYPLPKRNDRTTYLEFPIDRLKSAVPALNGIKFIADQDQLPVILAGVAKNIAEVLPRLPDLISREDVYNFQGAWDPSSQAGRLAAGEPSSREFKYLIHCQHNADGSTTIAESRTDGKGRLVEAGGVRGYGFANQWLFFSADNQPEFRFRYLGEQEKSGRKTFAIAFVQIPRKVGAPAQFMADGKKAPLYYQGILWVDQSSFDIVSLRTDLLAPPPKTPLRQLTTELTFHSVPIRGYDAVFWLPSEVDISSDLGAGPTEETHRYSDYHLFRAQARIVPDS
jgi:hypothetical protein